MVAETKAEYPVAPRGVVDAEVGMEVAYTEVRGAGQLGDNSEAA